MLEIPGAGTDQIGEDLEVLEAVVGKKDEELEVPGSDSGEVGAEVFKKGNRKVKTSGTAAGAGKLSFG